MDDMIDLATVRILNSPDIHDWPATTAITRLELRATGVHVEFTKKDGPDRWPDVPFGDPADHGSLQYTLWIVLKIGFQWFAAGCIEFWFGLDENGGPPQAYAAHWYYDASRWAPMTGHQPAVGERVGFLLTSGDARHGDSGVGLHERSNIVAIDFPYLEGVYTFDAPPVPAPPPNPPPVPPPAPPPNPPPAPPPPPAPHGEILELLANLVIVGARLDDHVHALHDAIAILDAQIIALREDGLRVHL